MRLFARSTFFAVATAALSFGLVACGGGGDDDDDTQLPPEGDHYHYVVDSVEIPLDSDQAEELGFDLDGDGTVDNQLGNILSALVQAGGESLDLQASIDSGVAEGDILLLADLQATDLASATRVGFSVYLGTNPSPLPCTDETDLVCGHHLDGSGSFDVDPATPADSTVTGQIAGGTFAGGPGNLSMQIALAAGSSINLNLVSARAEVTQVADGSLGPTRIGGAVPEENVQNDVIPAVHTTIEGVISEDCTGVGTDCGCTADSTGLTVLGIFDEDEDCTVTLEEIQTNSLIVTLLRSDVDTDGDGTADALSIGVGATAIAATYE